MPLLLTGRVAPFINLFAASPSFGFPERLLVTRFDERDTGIAGTAAEHTAVPEQLRHVIAKSSRRLEKSAIVRGKHG